MNIQVTAKHRITSDSQNITVEELAKPKKEGDEPRYYAVAYFTRIDQAFAYILDRSIRLSDALSVDALLRDVDEIRTSIDESLKMVASGVR